MYMIGRLIAPSIQRAMETYPSVTLFGPRQCGKTTLARSMFPGFSYANLEEFRARGAEVEDGAFGENLVVEGIDFRSLPVGTRFCCGEVILEMTQIGKECHHGCQIYQKMGDCIMPREGVFAKVIRGGKIRIGDEMKVAEDE